MACKTKNVYYEALYRKSLPTPALGYALAPILFWYSRFFKCREINRNKETRSKINYDYSAIVGCTTRSGPDMLRAFCLREFMREKLENDT